MKKNNKMTLKKARDVLGLTQKQLAREWGLSSVNVSRWETGRHKPLGCFQEKIDALIKRAEVQLVVNGYMKRRGLPFRL